MRNLPAVLVRSFCLVAAFFLASCKTGDYRYGNAAFTLPTTFSRIHSPGSFTALGRAGHDPEMFTVVRATHSQDPSKFTPQQWNSAGDSALKAMNSHRSFSNAREISRSSGYHGRFRTMDQALAGTMSNFGGITSDVVISSRLFHSKDEAYFFALAQVRRGYAADPARFSRIMSTVRLE